MANLDQIALLAALDGILLVDKPAGIASHDVVKDVKRRFNLVKVGHGGTLETNASGLFLLLLGDGTKISSDLMGADRAYSAVIRLGTVTDTCDRNGAVLASKPFAAITSAVLETALAGFRGDIFQTPPRFSAVLMHGATGYKVVPTVDDEEARPRLVHVYRLVATSFAPPLVGLDISCTKGASPRALARDLGEALGCGASLDSLRRTSCGRFRVSDALPYDDLLKLPPMELRKRVIPVAQAASR